MPSKSKQQQKFMGIVRSIQKGDAPASSFSKKAQKAAKDMKKSDVKKYAKTKHKGLPNKVKQETKVRSLIRKMVREILDEDFAGAYPKNKRKAFDKKRQKQSEVLGYKLMGKSDVKTEIDDATIKEGKLEEINFDKVVIPGKVKRFLDRFVDSMKDAQLNRLRRSAILYKVIQASGMSPKTLMADIQRIKRGLQKETKIKEGKDTIFDVAKKVMKDKQHQNYKSKKGMVRLDMQPANLFKAVYNKANDKTKEKINKMNEKQLYVFMTKLWSKFGKQVKL